MKEKETDARTVRENTLAEIGEMALANFEDIEELSSQGGPETNAAYQALEIVTWLAFLRVAEDASAVEWPVIERRIPGLNNVGNTERQKAIRKWVSQEATPQEMLAFLLEITACHILAAEDEEVQPIREAILENFTDLGVRGYERAMGGKKKAAKAEPAKKAKAPELPADQAAAAAPEPPEAEPAPPAAQVQPPARAPEEMDISALGITVEQLAAAYVGSLWSKPAKKPEAVKPVTFEGRKWVCLGSVSGGGKPRRWMLAPLYPVAETCNRFPGVVPRLNPGIDPGKGTKEAGTNYYFGVRVRQGKNEYVIGPPEEERTVTQALASEVQGIASEVQAHESGALP